MNNDFNNNNNVYKLICILSSRVDCYRLFISRTALSPNGQLVNAQLRPEPSSAEVSTAHRSMDTSLTGFLI